jgi:hypothetical protein
MLRVQLRDVYNPQFEIRGLVIVGEPFHITKVNGAVKNEISGLLRPTQDGRYLLTLAILEWQSAAANSRETEELTLALNKPWSAGPSQSTLSVRTVMLSRAEP